MHDKFTYSLFLRKARDAVVKQLIHNNFQRKRLELPSELRMKQTDLNLKYGKKELNRPLIRSLKYYSIKSIR